MAVNSQTNLSKFWLETKRIMKISKKPNRKEFSLTLKITLVGLLVTGGISFIIQLIATMLKEAAGIG
ncbi:MAG: protein translocase SEC61 complex subunit gamma [archaeon]|nr:protein translocase SEC61 complex subunit gamma [archaeon]